MSAGITDQQAVVASTAQVADAVYCTRLEAPAIAACARPGQFVQVRLRPGPAPLLRLPLSIAGADPKAGWIELLYEGLGPKTRLLAATRAGEAVTCLGPLGRGFEPPAEGRAAVLVGGGIGLPPLAFLGRRLRAAGRAAVLLAGARSAPNHLPDELLAAPGLRLCRSTDDGTCGHRGLVTDLLDAELDRLGSGTVFSCGPWPMLREVAARCRLRGTPCQVSMEAYMACGVGICMGCVVASVEPGSPVPAGEYGRYRRVCVEGPVFDALEIDWSRDG